MGKIVYNGREYLSAGTASTMQGATSTTDGVSGLVPQPLIADREKFLKGDGTWAAGGGGGSSVIANPSGTPTDTLQTVEIDGTIYEIEGGTGGGGELTEVDLWTNTTGVDVGTYTLSNSIDDYDFIAIYYGVYAEYTSGILISDYRLVSVKDLNQLHTDGKRLLITGWSNRTVYLDFNQTTMIISVTENGNTVLKVRGIKIGGGGGSNLIVDAQIYSTDERCVGVWKDNKPLYQKTIPFTLNAQPTHIDVSSLNIDSVVNEIGFVKHNTINYWLPIPYYEASGYNLFTNYDLDNGNIDIYSGNTVYTYYKNGALTIQYTKTTDAAGSGGYQAYGFSPIIYSTEEREVGVWIDNKPLYQKTFNTSNTTVNTPVTMADLTSLHIDTVVKYEGIYNRYVSGAQDDIDYAFSIYQSSTINNWLRIINKQVLQYQINLNESAESTNRQKVTIWYTKTTDTAGSGSYNTLGVPNVHYSTDEQVIGTWIDNKPLYAITLEINNASTGSITLDISNLNVDLMVSATGKWLRTQFSTNYWMEFGVYYDSNIRGYISNDEQGHLYVYRITRSGETVSKAYINLLYTKTTD